MTRHLIASGYALTKCGMTSAVPGTLMVELEKVNCQDCLRSLVRQGICPACGEQGLEWGTCPRNKSGVADGRLTMNDVETIFYLGCGHCSETLIPQVDPETVATFLTEQRWVP